MKHQHQDLPLNGARLALEPVRDKDLVLVVGVTKGEDVGTLHGLVKVSKDVVNDYNGLLGVKRTGDVLSSTMLAISPSLLHRGSHTSLVATNLLVGSLGLVS